MFQRIL